MARLRYKNYKRYTRKTKRSKNNKLATIGKVKKLINANIETKYKDVNLGTFSFDNTGTVVQINNISQGTTDSTRVGDEIRLRRVSIHGQVVQGAVTVPTNVRIMLVQLKDQVGTSLTQAMVLQHTASNQEIMNSPYRYDAKFIHVLKDIKMTITPYNFYAVNTQQFFRINHVFKKNAICQYDAGSATNCDNSIFLLFTSDKGAIDPQPTITFCSRIEYKDA